MERFHWTTFDVRSLLPPGWEQSVLDVVERNAQSKTLTTLHSTSREGGAVLELPTRGVGGTTVCEQLPWLRKLYETSFRDFAQVTTHEPVTIMSDQSHGVVLNVQTGPERYECHVDTNPIEGLLYFTNHPLGSGGDLILSNRGDVPSIVDVDEDAARIEPIAGHLVFFDGRQHSHYVRPLSRPDDLRVVAAMNFYVPSSPEEARPHDLNDHLAGRLVGVVAADTESRQRTVTVKGAKTTKGMA
jgi:hypothetical protein